MDPHGSDCIIVIYLMLLMINVVLEMVTWIVCVYGTERTTVQSSEFPETVENIDESEIPPTTQRLMGTRRGGMQ